MGFFFTIYMFYVGIAMYTYLKYMIIYLINISRSTLAFKIA